MLPLVGCTVGKVREMWDWGHLPKARGVKCRDCIQTIENKCPLLTTVDNIRDATAGADLPTFHPAPAGCELSVFSPVTVGELHTAIRRLSDKQCDTDLLPTWLFKLCADSAELMSWRRPFLCLLFNRSFTDGTVACTRRRTILPGLRNSTWIRQRHRPVSNLPFVSKLLKCLE